MPALPVTNTGLQKRGLIEMAFGQCGIAGYEFAHTANEIADALMNLNIMMYEEPWSNLGYVYPETGIGDAQDASGIPGRATSAVILCLANRLCAIKGKTLLPFQQAEMSRSRFLVMSQYASIGSMPHAPGTPRGLGSRIARTFNPFFDDQAADAVDPTITSTDGTVTTVPDPSEFIPSLDFEDERNSQYLGVI